MSKIVFIGAGSQFGAATVLDLLSFEELRDSEIVLVDINPGHLRPVAQYARMAAAHFVAPAKIIERSGWRDGVLDGAKYVITAFAQGGPAYAGLPYRHEIEIPRRHGIYQNVGDTAGIGGVFRLLRTAPELLAIAQDLDSRSPGAYLLNYVNPMAMLTRVLSVACPGVHTLGLCHNIQYGIREIARRLDCPHTDLTYMAAGINHMDWFLRLQYADGSDAYPDLRRAAREDASFRHQKAVQCELLDQFGYFTTESSEHCAEYVPWFMSRSAARESMLLQDRQVSDAPATDKRWGEQSGVMRQLTGAAPFNPARSFEYAVPIIHGLESACTHRAHINVLNHGLIDNLPPSTCVEVPCTIDRTGVSRHRVGPLPTALAAMCSALAHMQMLASEAFLEKDLTKALQACLIDPCTAACATPKVIRACFNELLEAERPWLERHWGSTRSV